MFRRPALIRPALITVLALMCYAYVLPRWADWSQNSRLALVRALAEQGTVRIDAFVETTGDYALIDGHSYSDKAPGPALLAAPIHALIWPLLHYSLVEKVLALVAQQPAFESTMQQDGAGLGIERVRVAVAQYLLTLLVIALPAALSVAALDWLLRQWFQPWPAAVGALSFGLATPFSVYAGNFYSHALVAALLVGGWALIERARFVARPNALLLLSGLLLGWAAISEYPSVLIGGCVGLYALHHVRWRAWYVVLGSLPALAALVIYDLAAFGTPVPIGYAHSALWQTEHQTGFLSLTYPHPEALWGLLAGRFRGLFFRAPWLLLAIPGVVLWWREGRLRSQLAVSVAAACTLCLVYGSSRMWFGGFAAGPRYIVPAIPFLVVPAVWVLDHVWNHRGWRFSFMAIIAVSLVLVWTEALAGQQFPPDTIAEPWLGWTWPAWQRGDIARNAGMALGLSGVLSILPLAIGGISILAILVYTFADRRNQSEQFAPSK